MPLLKLGRQLTARALPSATALVPGAKLISHPITVCVLEENHERVEIRFQRNSPAGRLAFAARADDKPEDFLTKDGTLKEALQVKDVQGGFAGFTGKAWTVQPGGEWTISKVMNEKMEVEQKGTLT